MGLGTAFPGLAFPGLCWPSSAEFVEVIVAGVAFLAAAGADVGDEGGVSSNPNNLSVTGADCARSGSAGGGGEDVAAGATSAALPFSAAMGAGDLGAAGGEFGVVLPGDSLKDSPANKSIVTRRRFKVG